MTSTNGGDLVVVFSPHPDDDVIACGGTIVKKIAQGDRVKIVISTDGSMSHSAVLGIHEDPTPAELTAIRQKEAENAAKAMGLDAEDVHFLGFRDTDLAGSFDEFRTAVTAFLSAYPDVAEIYVPHDVREMNADHRLTGVGVLEAVAALGLTPRVRKFVVWDEQTEAEFAFVNRRPAAHAPADGERRISVDISGQLAVKLSALAEHRTQVSLFTPAQVRPVVPEAFVERVCGRTVEEFWVVDESLEYLAEWPAVSSAYGRNAADEQRIADIVGQMTLEEKLGQMIQPELAELTPEDVRDYKIGSALNGAGIWPDRERHAHPDTWRATVERFAAAAAEAYRDRPFSIPFAWATDAVHGHNNVFGATIFPHNIGLGAAGDPDLVRRIGRATAREIAATGMHWTFAPTVTTPRDRRWGRYYEGYSEDPAIVHAYAREMTRGLQGNAAEFRSGSGVIATIKHWVADGGTAYGADRGDALCSEDLVRNIHARGFFSGIGAGAQAVMASFSSWVDPANYDHTPGRETAYNFKVHGSRFLLNDVLKEKVGFDGIVISDWDAHAEVAGCSVGDAGYAIAAGIDVLMVAGRDAWVSVHRTAAEQVRAGVIPMSRIDDAVTRVLRVKLRAGLFDATSETVPVDVLGCAEHRALAREAIRKSLVLLKNNDAALPIARTARVLVTGSGADDIRKQAGGWTLSWQGDDVDLDDLPGASTVGMAVREVVGADRATVDPWLEHADPAAHDVAIVVIGEDSYAEMRGTIKPWRTLEYAALKPSYAKDLATLRTLRERGVTVVTVLLTGRPLYVTEEINLSDAFVVGWLPGPDGGGITDVLFAGADGGPAYDFQGRLANSWPRRKDSLALNRIPPHIPGYVVPPEEVAPTGEHTPLFGYGYGLTYADAVTTPALPIDDSVDTSPYPAPDGSIEVPGDAYRFRIGGHNTWSRLDISTTEPTDCVIVHADPLADGGLSLRFKSLPAFVYAQALDGEPRDLRGYVADGRLVFDVRVHEQPDGPLYLALHDDYPSQPGLEFNAVLAACPIGEWTTITVPLADLARIGTDFKHVDVAFMWYSADHAHIDVREIRIEGGGPHT
jgi:beta-glucosidase